MDIKNLKDNKYLWFTVSTLIMAALIYFAEPERFIDSIQSAKLLPLFPALVFGLSVFIVWSFVWYRVFKACNIKMSYRKALRVFMAGNFMNAITPLGQAGGEPLMAYLLKENSGASYEKSLSSIFSADILNAIPPATFIIGGSIYLALFKSLNNFIIQTVYMVLLVTILGGILLYLLWFESGTIEKTILILLEKITAVIGKGEKLLETLEEKFEEIENTFKSIGQKPIQLLKTGLIAHLGFVLQILNFYFIMLALGIQPDFTPIYFIVPISALASFSPTPGGSGTYEAAMASLITVFIPGTSFATGLTAAILFRLTTYWPGIPLGWLALNSLNGEAKNHA